MTVYVDPLIEWGGSASFRWTQSCHLMADTLTELHAFAKTIGLQYSWFQDSRSAAHYDLNARRRRVAIKRGAVEVSLRFRPENRGYNP